MKTKYKQLKDSFDKEVLKLERLKGKYEEKKSLFENITNKLKEDKEKVEIYKSVNLLFEKASVIARKKIKDEIEVLITHGLQSVFEDPNIEFKVEFVSRRNQIEADFYLEWIDQEKKIRGQITETFGGGVVDIISIVLRLVVLELANIHGPLFLDEPGKMLSSQYVPNFGKFLVELTKTFKRQIILITHNEMLASYADVMFNVKLNEKGESIVEQA
jgi:DNA repair exonuclease SbcCD ATPase subunit